jgi:hypothetical protein
LAQRCEQIGGLASDVYFTMVRGAKAGDIFQYILAAF